MDEQPPTLNRQPRCVCLSYNMTAGFVPGLVWSGCRDCGRLFLYGNPRAEESYRAWLDTLPVPAGATS